MVLSYCISINWPLNTANVSATAPPIGGFATSDGVFRWRCYANATGATSSILYDQLSFSGNTNSKIEFDLSYAQYDASSNDQLKVEISTDCGATYNTVYEKEGLDLSTIATYSGSEWTPATAADWRNETIDLNAYNGEKISIRFVAVNDYSNSTFIDNVEVSGVLSTSKETLNKELVVYPNPVSDKLSVRLSNNQTINKVKLYSLLGKEINISNVLKQRNSVYEIDTKMLSTGIYIVKVETDLAVGFRKIIKR